MKDFKDHVKPTISVNAIAHEEATALLQWAATHDVANFGIAMSCLAAIRNRQLIHNCDDGCRVRNPASYTREVQ